MYGTYHFSFFGHCRLIVAENVAVNHGKTGGIFSASLQLLSHASL